MIGFAGLSHLGVVSTLAAAAKGQEVVGYDPDGQLAVELASGRFPFREPGLAELFADHRERIRFTSEPNALRRCELTFFSRDVPTDPDNRSDLSPLGRLMDEVFRTRLEAQAAVILSQVPPGFTREAAHALRKQGGGGDLRLFYQVETLVFGSAVERALRPERFIVGCPDPRAELPAAYAEYLSAFHCPILKMGYESAELAKIAVNLFLIASLTTTNTLSELCEKIGAEWSEVAPALRLDRRIGPHAYLTPGLGMGGGNLERDLATAIALAREHGTESAVLESFAANSRRRRDWALRVLHSEVLSAGSTPCLALWGLAYKPNTSVTKNSPALALIDALPSVSVRAYDPEVTLEKRTSDFVQVGSALEACQGADALAIMTPWSEFAGVDLAEMAGRMTGRVLVDPFGVLDGSLCRKARFRHFQLGSSAVREEL